MRQMEAHLLCVLPFASCANQPGKIAVSSPQPVLRSTKTVTARRSGRAASRAPTRMRAKTGEGDSVRGKPVSSAPSSPRLERRGAPGSKREPTTEKVRPARTSSPRFLLVLKSRAAALFDRAYSSRFLFFFLAPFDVRPGPGYAWPRRGSWVPTLIRGLPSRGTPAKSKEKLAEIR